VGAFAIGDERVGLFLEPRADVAFAAARDRVRRAWRKKLGPRRIVVGDREVSDTLEAQTAYILVNATRVAFRPGPRNYDRTWIRDGSSQALALLWAGLIDEAKRYVLWYAERIYPSGLVPPILNVAGTVNRARPASVTGRFIRSAAVATTMGPGVKLDLNDLMSLVDSTPSFLDRVEGTGRLPLDAAKNLNIVGPAARASGAAAAAATSSRRFAPPPSSTSTWSTSGTPRKE